MSLYTDFTIVQARVNPMPTALIPTTPRHDAAREQMIQLAENGVDSPRSKRNYRIALNDFFNWHEGIGAPMLNKALVNSFKAHLSAKGLAPATINLKLSAVRKLVNELADNETIPQETANGISRVKGVKTEGVRMGNWLTEEQAQQLLDAPTNTPEVTLKGLRDRAILAVLIGCALRREECASLTVEHIQQREGRWVIVDLIGKRGKVRSVPVQSWVKMALDDWTAAAGITSGNIWRAFRKGDHLDQDSTTMSAQAIWSVVNGYATACGFPNIAPHDLRRTSAKLMLKGGASLEQISMVLGHASLDVTKKYLGVELELQDAATDRIKLKLTHRQHRLPGA